MIDNEIVNLMHSSELITLLLIFLTNFIDTRMACLRLSELLRHKKVLRQIRLNNYDLIVSASDTTFLICKVEVDFLADRSSRLSFLAGGVAGCCGSFS